MKKVLLLSICLLVFVSFNFTDVEASNFSDLEQGIYYDAINYLVENGYANGYVDNTIRLNNSITRGELAKLAVTILFENQVPNGVNNLIDIGGHWAEEYIKIANENGIINGYPDKTFRPDNKITYDEVITIITRMFAGEDELINIKIWPTDFVTYAKNKGILQNISIGNNSFQANRGDTFLMLYNAFKNISEIDFTESIDSMSISTATTTGDDRIIYSNELPKNNIDAIFVKIDVRHDIVLEDITIPVKIELTNKNNNKSMTYYKKITILSNTEKTIYNFNIYINDLTFKDNYYEEYDETDYVIKVFHSNYVYDSKVLTFKWDNTKEADYARNIIISDLLFSSSEDDEHYSNSFYLSDDFSQIIIRGDFEWPETSEVLAIPLFMKLDGPRSWGWEGSVWLVVDSSRPIKERVWINTFYVNKYTGKWPAGTYTVSLEYDNQQLIKKAFEVKY